MKNKKAKPDVIIEDCISKSRFNSKEFLLNILLIPFGMFILSSIICFVILIIFSAFLLAVPTIGITVVIIFLVAYVISIIVSIIKKVIEIIDFCTNKISVTDIGIVGQGARFRKFDLSYSDIAKVEINGAAIVVSTNVPANKNGTKTKTFSVLNVKNRSEIFDAYSAKLAELYPVEPEEEVVPETSIPDEPSSFA